MPRKPAGQPVTVRKIKQFKRKYVSRETNGADASSSDITLSAGQATEATATAQSTVQQIQEPTWKYIQLVDHSYTHINQGQILVHVFRDFGLDDMGTHRH
jgi:hypothetical protein